MSIEADRRSLADASKKLADLEKSIAHELANVAKLEADAGKLARSITPSASASTIRSKQLQIERKNKEAAAGTKKVADLRKKAAEKKKEVLTLETKIAKAEVAERKRQTREAKKERQQELAHERALTAEVRHRVRLETTLKNAIIAPPQLPSQIAVLYISANPITTSQLHLDQEIRLIQQQLRASKFRDSVILHSRWAVRVLDFFQALNELKPEVVHFSGHGEPGELFFVDDDQDHVPVTVPAMVQLIRAAGSSVRVMIFNACFSAEQAQAITEYVPVAIGMSSAIDDHAARVFAGQLYSAIGFGESMAVAYDQAVAALMASDFPDHGAPALYSGDGVDPSQVVLVSAPGPLSL
jgi:hypothetical protein